MPDIIDPVTYRAANASAKEQMKFQERMSNTAHQREVKDLIAAGLNPVLSSGGQGASTPTGAAGYVGDANAKLFDLLNQQLVAQNQLLSDVVTGSSGTGSGGSGKGRKKTSAKRYYNSTKSYDSKNKVKEGYFFKDPDNIVDTMADPLLNGKGNIVSRAAQSLINGAAYIAKHVTITSNAGSQPGTSAYKARQYQESTGKSATLGGRVGEVLKKALSSAKKIWNAGKIKPAQGTKERMLFKRLG